MPSHRPPPIPRSAACLLFMLLATPPLVAQTPVAQSLPTPSVPASTLTCPAASGWAPSPPEQVLHRYQVTGRASAIPYRAQAEIRWQRRPGQAYTLEYDVKAFWGAGRTQTSEGLWQTSGLRPLRFTEKGKRTLLTVADPAQRSVKLPLASEAQPWAEGSQDKLSAWVQLGWWVACAASPFEKTPRLTMPVWASGDIETWTWVVGGWGTLETAYGPRKALQLTRPAGLGGDSRIDLWFVPEWGALPIRVKVTQANGDEADQVLTERSPAP